MSVTPFPKKDDQEQCPEDIAKVLCETASTLSRVAASIVRSGAKKKSEPIPPLESYISPEEAARLFNVTRQWLYRHADEIPGCQRLSRKCLRIPESGLRKFLAAKRG